MTAKMLLFLTFQFAVNAQAITPGGAISGGGGKGLLCTDNKGGTTVELLDLWEARELHKETPIPSLGTVEADTEAALLRLKNSYLFQGVGGLGDGNKYQGQDFLLAYLQKIATRFLDPNSDITRLRGASLDSVNDADPVAKPKNCVYVQLVNYSDSGEIVVDQDSIDRMDTLNQAALIAHEAIYAWLRDMAAETTSVRTRRAVGYVFSGNTFSLTQPNAPSTGGIVCQSDEFMDPANVIEIYPKQSDDPSLEVLGISILKMDKSYLIGAPSLDFQIRYTSGSNVIKNILSGQCQGDGLSRWGFQFGGPVEYDRTLAFTWTCNSGKPSFYLTSSLPGVGGETQTELTCQYK